MDKLFRSLINNVPSYTRFLSVSEIDALIQDITAMPGVKHRVMGKTVNEEDLTLIEIGDSDTTALIIGVPHSDEPLGSLVTTYFARWLAQHPQEVKSLGWRWLFSHAGEKLGLDIAIALCSCGAIAWLIYAIDEAVRSARYRDKNFWFRVTGLATGSDEFSAQSYRWSEVVGARRRIQHMAGLWDTRKKPKFDGLEVLLRGGGTIWIPEEYSNDLDQLCEVLSPNDTEVITRGDQAAKC